MDAIYESMKGHSSILSNILPDVDANLTRKKVCGIEFYFHIQSYNQYACLLYTIHEVLFFR